MRLKWGVLGVAKIAINQVIPALQQSEYGDLIGVASRNGDKARETALRFKIPKSYSSYQALLDDHDIDVVYIPLPNQLHFPWIEKCLKAGKHVLCEKPITLNTSEVKSLISLRNETKLKVSEAFMVKSHPQWTKVKSLIDGGSLGPINSVNGFFSYKLNDLSNVRYVKEWGGGGIYDVGCYPVFTVRHVFQERPTRVFAATLKEESTGVDILASVIVDFPTALLTFTCGMQMVPNQFMQFYGTEKWLQLRLPFNPLHKNEAVIEIHNNNINTPEPELISIPRCNQYTLMCDDFSLAVIEDREVSVPLEDSLINMAVLEALLCSAETGEWVVPNYN